MSLNGFQFINGLLSFLTVSLCFLVGLVMVIRYFQYKNKTLLFVGFAWMGIYQPWWPGTLAFLLNGLGFIDGPLDPLAIYPLVGTMFIPVTATAWFLGFTSMMFKKRRKLIVGFYAILTAVMDVVILILVMVDLGLVGEFQVVNADYGLLLTVYYMFINVSVAIPCALMGRESMKSELPEVRVRGHFLLAAALCYFLGGLLDVGLIEAIPWFIFITRTILMAGSVLFYLGFLLPEPLEKLLSGE